MDSQLSKSERKRRAKGIETLVNELAALPESEIAALPCELEIRNEILSAKNLKGGARKRQLKYATRLLRDRSVDDLYEYLTKKKGSQLKKNHEFQELEHLRNLLLNETVQQYEDIMHGRQYIEENETFDLLRESVALKIIAEQLPGIDQTLLRDRAVQFVKTRNKKFSREIFRILKAALEKIHYSQNQGRENGL